MAKQQLEDRLLSREGALDNLKAMLSEPCFKNIATTETIKANFNITITGETAEKIKYLLSYVDTFKAYANTDTPTIMKLQILREVYKKYMGGRWN